MATITKINGQEIGTIIGNNTVINQTIDAGVGTVGNAYYLTSTDDTWLTCDNTSEATVSGTVGVCSSANEIMFSGLLTSASHGLGATGEPLYASTSGSLTSVVPDTEGHFVKRVGFVEDSNSIRVLIEPDYYELGPDSIAFTLATQAEAEAGTVNDVWMSPQRTSQAIAANVIYSARIDHGTISGPIDLSANYTEHTGDFTTSFTLTLTDFVETRPSSAFTLTVSGSGTPTITLAAPTTPVFWTTQTLSTLADGDYRALFLYDGTNYDVYVDVKP